MSGELRKTGIEIIGDVPWGTHFCQFYRTPQDLLDILVPYFSEGLRNNEFCMWVTSEPLEAEAARAALAAAMPDLEEYLRRGQIEIIPHTEWYLEGGSFNSESVLDGWAKKLDAALAAGYEGLRLTGNTFWLEGKDWGVFTDYEAAVDGVIGQFRMLAVCTYSLDRCGANEILDVIANHRFALIRRNERWELVESADSRRNKEELKRLAQFPEQNPNPVLRLTLGGDLVYSNPPASALLEAMGRTEGGPLPAAISALADQAANQSGSVEAELPDSRGQIYWFAAVRPQGEPYVNLYARDVTSRKEAENELERSREWLRVTLTSIGDAVLATDTDCRITFLNPVASSLTGWTIEGALGRPIEEVFRVVNELTREPVEDLCFRVLAEGRAINLANNSSLIAKDGREVPIEDSAAPILDTAGRVAGAVLVFHDVTAKREAQRSLRESEERLRRAQEIAHLGSWELDLTNNRLSWSDEVYRLFGLTPGEFGATYGAFLDAVHPDDRAAVDAAYSGSLKEGRDQYEIEHRIVRRDTGEIRVVLEKCEHKRDASGRVIRSIGMVHDITEAKKAEILRQALAEQERLRLGAAVEQASDSVVMVDLDGQIQYVNVAFESIYKTARDQAVGHSYFDHLAGKSPLLPAIREAIALGRPWHGHLSGSIAGGRPIELEVTISPAADPSGKVIGGLITEKDVTQENALQRQVRQSQKMEALGTLAGGITHDFNNILSTIFINTELAMLDLDLANPARRSLPIVLQAANRGRELVKQIITFSRQREWERKPLEVTPIVKEGLKFLRSTLSKDIAIHESIVPDCGPILADPSQVHQILVNLCQNAALAMADQAGDLEVKLEPVQVDTTLAARHPDLKPGPYVRLTVADNGCGMTTQLLERIFEPFFTTRNHGEGSGLGLAVVHGIVKSYDGAITVYSEPGKGSVFSVYIPRLEGETSAAEKGKRAQPEKGKEHILLVEDEEAQLKGMTRVLERLGYRVTAKPTGRTALTAFKKKPDAFDLVITDQAMPRMTGIELARALVNVRPDIPIILCTGFSEKVGGETVGHDGIRSFVMKPFSVHEISKHIRAVLRGPGFHEHK